jgi:hypothetical protein
MSVNWDWKDKKGEVVWKPTEDQNKPPFKWNIYEANCLGCCLYEYTDEEGKEMYQFECFFSDVHHLKKILGLEKCYDGKKNDMFKEWYGDYEIDYIKLDINFDNDKLIKYFAEAGYEVRIYKGDKNGQK